MSDGDIERVLAEAQARTEARVKKRPGKQDLEAFAAAHDQELAAERALAAARGEVYAVPFELGVRWSGTARHHSRSRPRPRQQPLVWPSVPE